MAERQRRPDGMHNVVPLGDAALADLPGNIRRPRYDRAQLRPGIVHIGMGNFHRAHQAWYLHRLMEQGLAQDWAIIGAGVRSADAKMRQRMASQDCLTTLIELGPEGCAAEIIGSIIDFLPVADDNAPLIAAMSDPAIRIVSLTITEGGYYLTSDGGFDAAHPDMQHDAANPGQPRTAFGAMVSALAARRARGHGAFTGQSCDNLQNNGAILRQTIVGLARMTDADLADWIEAEAAFPNSMVDCIVPATGEKERELVQSLGVGDAIPVTHENFRQWVIEDAFCAGRPQWEAVGATLTQDVHLYERMKIRVLNAGHQVLANVGEILNIPTVAAAMEDSDIAAFFDRVQRNDILPQVAPVPEMDPSAYLDLIKRRFANPAIHDTIRRVAFDGSARHAGFVLPILTDALEQGGSIEGLALVEAFWARMCAGMREDGSRIADNDPHWGDLTSAALAAKSDPRHWLGQEIYGDVRQDPRFADAFERWLRLVWDKGGRAAMRTYLTG